MKRCGLLMMHLFRQVENRILEICIIKFWKMLLIDLNFWMDSKFIILLGIIVLDSIFKKLLLHNKFWILRIKFLIWGYLIKIIFRRIILFKINSFWKQENLYLREWRILYWSKWMILKNGVLWQIGDIPIIQWCLSTKLWYWINFHS